MATTTATPRSRIITISDLEWQERQPGVRMKNLWEDPETKRRAVVTQPPLPQRDDAERREGDDVEEPKDLDRYVQGLPPGGECSNSKRSYFNMLTARAATMSASTRLAADSTSINIFAQRLSGIVSVGLNAVAFVNDT